jgi:hypothetical protein
MDALDRKTRQKLRNHQKIPDSEMRVSHELNLLKNQCILNAIYSPGHNITW